MSDAYRFLFFIILPLLVLVSWLQPKEIEVTVCTLESKVTYINRMPISDKAIDQMGLGSCKTDEMDREDYYRLRNSFNF